MGRPKSKGAYVPLAANYYMDDAILEVGPEAELLFVRILSFLASVPSDGFITDRQLRTIVALGLRNVQRRVDSLLGAGLLVAQSGGYLARSWQKWNRSTEEVGRLLAKDRERKAQDSAAKTANSGRNPDGIQQDSALQSSTEQSSTEQTPPNGGVARSRATRIPDPFHVTAAMREWAAAEVPGVDVDRSTRTFVDYWRGESGAKAAKRDWIATWRNWLRRDAERTAPVGRPRPLTRTEQNLSIVAELEARESAAQKGLTA
ncbi:hypothetical protein [uncultured Microbacterium sp.]|uniref:hypothetical protein n=1 Tax=uncultured Microbacterium sp. TaxID=191216 RepID=UPI0025D20D13|nr:hypothetical protein [uncultured Microbacterium sp.]